MFVTFETFAQPDALGPPGLHLAMPWVKGAGKSIPDLAPEFHDLTFVLIVPKPFISCLAV
eukprot:10428269-Heterocapsa_arctica.AAC.1